MSAEQPQPGDHLATFALWDEDTRLAHLIIHGHELDALREASEEELNQLHAVAHQLLRDGAAEVPEPPNLPELADKAVNMAAAMREHLAAGRWAEVYACADWLGEHASTIRSWSWAAHPEARPQRWLA